MIITLKFVIGTESFDTATVRAMPFYFRSVNRKLTSRFSFYRDVHRARREKRVYRGSEIISVIIKW